MYQRFTDRARKAMELAQDEARRFNHEYVGTEHLLLGMIKEGTGVGANVLTNLGIDLTKVRREVEKIVLPGTNEVSAPCLPLTLRSQRVIEFAIEEASNIEVNYVGSEHLLLGLVREDEGVAAQVLVNLGLSLKTVRREVLALLGHNVGEPLEPDSPEKDLPRKLRLALEQLDDLLAEYSQEIAAAVSDQDFVQAAQLFQKESQLRQVRKATLESYLDRDT